MRYLILLSFVSVIYSQNWPELPQRSYDYADKLIRTRLGRLGPSEDLTQLRNILAKVDAVELPRMARQLESSRTPNLADVTGSNIPDTEVGAYTQKLLETVFQANPSRVSYSFQQTTYSIDGLTRAITDGRKGIRFLFERRVPYS